jgi:superfamily II DNA or RNA helicase
MRAQLKSGSKRVLCVMPCGSGKAFMLASLLAELKAKNPHLRALILVPKVNLVQQLSQELQAVRVPHGVYCATLKQYKVQDVTLGSYQSVSRLSGAKPFDVVVLDECHRHDPSDDSNSRQLLTRHSHDDTRVIGFTATPYRGAKPLWAIGSYWPKPCYTMPITELTRMGYLVPAKLIGGNHGHDTSKLHIKAGEWDQQEVAELAKDMAKLRLQIKDALPRLKNCRKVVWMCIDQEHARMVCKQLQDYQESAEVVISDSSWDEREESLKSFEEGDTRHLVSVSVVTEGYDYPEVDAIILLRPMRSIVSYIQSVGRALRLHQKKTHATVLDYGGVVAACGPLDRPSVDIDGAASDRARASRQEIQEELGYKVVRCENCGVFYFPPPSEGPPCPDCGHKQTAFNKMRNLKDTAQEGSLYAEHPWGRSYVVALGMSIDDNYLTLEFQTKTNGQKSTHTIKLYAPVVHKQPNVMEMGALRRTKKWCRDVFGAPKEYGARAMCNWVIHHSTTMPKVLLQLDSGDYKTEGSQPLTDKERPLEEVVQERLL